MTAHQPVCVVSADFVDTKNLPILFPEITKSPCTTLQISIYFPPPLTNL